MRPGKVASIVTSLVAMLEVHSILTQIMNNKDHNQDRASEEECPASASKSSQCSTGSFSHNLQLPFETS